MGGLVSEILAVLRTITAIKFTSVWNNQFQYMEDGKSYSFPMPCSFVQVENDNSMDIGGKYQGSDLDITIHIGQDVLNGDLMDENLTIFELRDLVIKAFSVFKPTTGGLMVKVSEGQDFDHTNIYHYEIKFKTQWIDNTAVPIEYYSIPPTALSATITTT